jgi:hypothetical protein
MANRRYPRNAQSRAAYYGEPVEAPKPAPIAAHYKSERVYEGTRPMGATEKKDHREQVKRAINVSSGK